MTLHDLKAEVAAANRALETSGLVRLTWGNVSGIDRERGLVAIKPSGVPYRDLTPDSLAVVDLDGNRVGNHDINPSSDTPTHLELYKAWPEVGGICHTHSHWATAFAQAGRNLPCLGTTHADHFHGTVPVVRALTAEEIAGDYERRTGTAIVEQFAKAGINPVAVPAALQLHHAPFTWGATPSQALENSIALEFCASMAAATLSLNPQAPAIPQRLLDKHHLRKHGPDAYYGQQKT